MAVRHGRRGLKDLKDRRDRKDLKDHRELKGLRVLKDHRDPQEQRHATGMGAFGSAMDGTATVLGMSEFASIAVEDE